MKRLLSRRLHFWDNGCLYSQQPFITSTILQRKPNGSKGQRTKAMRHAGRSSTPTIPFVITVSQSNQELEALFCYHDITKQPRAGSFVVYYSIFKGNQVLEALTLLYLITTGHSFPESPMKGHWQQCQRVFNETPRNLLASRRGS